MNNLIGIFLLIGFLGIIMLISIIRLKGRLKKNDQQVDRLAVAVDKFLTKLEEKENIEYEKKVILEGPQVYENLDKESVYHIDDEESVTFRVDEQEISQDPVHDVEPEKTIEDYRGVLIRICSQDEYVTIPYLLKDDEPSSLQAQIFPVVLIPFLCERFEINEKFTFNDKPISGSYLRAWIKEYELRWQLDHNNWKKEGPSIHEGFNFDIPVSKSKSKSFTYQSSISKERILPDMSFNTMVKVIRYKDNDGKVIEKVTKGNELYMSYLKRFPFALLLTLPNAEEFMKWYEEASDEILKMVDLSDDVSNTWNKDWN